MSLRMSSKVSSVLRTPSPKEKEIQNTKPRLWRGFCFVLVFLLIINSGIFAQKTIEIQGRVIDRQDTFGVYNVKVILQGNDTSFIVTNTNEEGKFKFVLSRNTFRKILIYTELNKDIKSKSAPCGYLYSDEKFQIYLNDSISKNYNFKITPLAPHCLLWEPKVLFKKNSTVFIDSVYNGDKYLKVVDDLTKYLNLLYENPSVIIEVGGHSSTDEDNSFELSSKRVQTVIDWFMQKGIPQGRIIGKAYGVRKLKITDQQIKKSSKKDYEALHQVNRRVYIRIISWDYPAPDPPKYRPKIDTTENTDLIPPK